jgi:hypothetical protein
MVSKTAGYLRKLHNDFRGYNDSAEAWNMLLGFEVRLVFILEFEE